MSITYGLVFSVVLKPDGKGLIDPQLLDSNGQKVTLQHMLKSIKNNGWMVTGCSYSDERLAEALGISKRTVQNLIQGRPTTLDVMFRLQALCESIKATLAEATKRAKAREAKARREARP